MVQPVVNSHVPRRGGHPRVVRTDIGVWVSDMWPLCIYMGLVCTMHHLHRNQDITVYYTFLLHLYGATCRKFTRTWARGASEDGAQ